MHLRLTKQLTPKASEQLQTLVKHLGVLRNLRDGPYLKEALEQKPPVWQCPTAYFEPLLTLNLGASTAAGKFNLTRNANNGIYFNKDFRPSEKIVFEIALVRNGYPSPGTSVVVSVENNTFHTVEMALEPKVGGTSGNLFALANYFYDKPAFYQKISAFLTEKSTLLGTQISQEYVVALRELFSLEPSLIPGKAYRLPSAFSQQENCSEDFPAIRKAAIFSVAFFYRPYKTFPKVLNQELEICLTLSQTGELVYDIIPVYGTEIFEPRQVLTFVNKNTKLWLAELEALVAFGLSLAALPNVKTKIFLSNI